MRTRRPVRQFWPQQGMLTYVWGEQGGRPPAPRDCRYSWAYIFGAVCPARGTGAALVMPFADKQAMTLHLAEISQAVTPGAHAVVIVDGAGWHKPGGRLTLPSNVSTLTLPAYAPELNPQDNIWQFLRQNYLANRVFDTYDHIVQARCDGWNALIQQPERITTIASREWAKAVSV